MSNEPVSTIPTALSPRPITHVLQIPLGMVHPNDSDARFLLNRAVFGLLHGAAAADVAPAYIGPASVSPAADVPQDTLALLDELLGQMRRDQPCTGDLLPNRAGDERRAQAALIQGYLDALEPIVAALRARVAAEVNWEVAADRLLAGGNLVLAARSGNAFQTAGLLRDAAERIENGECQYHDESEGDGLWFRFELSPAQAAASPAGTGE